MLAALPRSPGNYSPFERPELAQRRRAIVVARLLEEGYISEAEAKAANRTPLGLVPPERRRTSGQYFLEYLQQSLEAKYGNDVLYKSGLAIYTTLDPGLQRAAEQALREGLLAVAARQAARAAGRGKARSRPGVPEGAVVVMEAATGYVKALIGGADFARTEFNRALHAHRQPGSAFKPFVYLAALEAGHAPTEMLDDSPIRYESGGKVWAPENYDGKFRGPVTLQQSLEESINVPTIRLLEQVGVNPVIEAARRAGIQSPLPHDLTLALGSGDVTLLELTAAYGTFANQGIRMEPLMVRYVTDAQGRLVEENIPQGREAIDPGVAIGLTQMLRGVVERGTGVAARVLERPLAGKTGTTNDFSNAWFLGYTPSIVAGVWVGHDRPRSLGHDETGARAALPIWVAVMRAALRGQPVEDFPAPRRAGPERPARRRARPRPRYPGGPRVAGPRQEAGRAERSADQRRQEVVEEGRRRRAPPPGGAGRRGAPPTRRLEPAEGGTTAGSRPRPARAAAPAHHAALGGVEGDALGADRPPAAAAAVEPGPVAEDIQEAEGEGELHPGRCRARVERAQPSEEQREAVGWASRSAVSRATASIIRAPWPSHSRSSRSRRNGCRMSK